MTYEGKIIKGIAGFYYVQVDERLYECKAKGAFRNQKLKPLVGDNVTIDIISEESLLGNINAILPRVNELIRPAVSNVDQALVIFAVADPVPNLNLLDRFLIMMEKQNVKTTICFNKEEILSKEEVESLIEIYEPAGYRVLTTSTYQMTGLDELKVLLEGKTTVVAGPSGVGKSSIINQVYPDAKMETGELSEKIKRGKHTTRHSELFCIYNNTFIMDTPGFSSMFVQDLEKEELKDYFPEFEPYEPECKFNGCLHLNEPTCGVKDALVAGKISDTRYNNYKLLYEELKNVKKY